MRILQLFKSKNLNLNFYLLLFIIILGFVLRTYHIADNPPGLFCDEASIGFNAYSILESGKDEYGKSYPIFFQSFGDFRHPLAVYSTVPFVALFGLNEISVRLHSAAFGLITIILMFFIGRQIHSNSLGLISAFITSTMPWLIHYNRAGFEFTIYSAFFAAAIFLLLKAGQDKFYIIPAFSLSALTLYTYQPAKLLIPLLLLGVILIYRKTYFKNKIKLIIGVLIFFIISIPLILSFINGEATARFNLVSVFSANKPLPDTFKLIINNYFTQFSPEYFLKGEPTFITRHFINGLIPLLTSTIPFLIIGILYILYTFKKESSQLLIFWLILYPVAGAVTAEGPFTSRSIIGAALFALLIGFGITVFIYFGKKLVNANLLLSFIIAVIFINSGLFVNFYFEKYPLYSADYWGWQFGARDTVKYFSVNKQMYDDLFLAPNFNAPEIFLKFYAPNDCGNCKVGLPENNYIPGRRQIFAVTPDYILSHPEYIFRQVKAVYYPNGSTAFILAEIEN